MNIPIIKQKIPNTAPSAFTCNDSGSKSQGNCENKCPKNKVLSIAKVNGKAVVTMDDCTFYEGEATVFDESTLNTAKKLVTGIKVDIPSNSIKVTYHENKTGEKSIETITLPDEVHVVSGDTTASTLTLAHNTGDVITVDLTTFKTGVMNDVRTALTDAISAAVANINSGISTQLSTINSQLSEVPTNISKVKVKSFTFDKDKKEITLTLNSGDSFVINLSELIAPDKYISSGSILNGNKLKLVFADGSTVEIDLTSLIAVAKSATFTGVTFSDTNLVWELSDGNTLTTNISGALNNIVTTVQNSIQTSMIQNATREVINNVVHLDYRIVNQAGNYTLAAADLDGRTLVRGTATGNQQITIPKPANERTAIGKAVIIRKAAGVAGSLLTLVPSSGVTLTPSDGAVLRRVGSTVTLVYTGSNNWDIFGELP